MKDKKKEEGDNKKIDEVDIKKVDGVDEEDIIVVMTVRCIDMAAPTENIDKKPCTECGEMTWISTSFRDKNIDKIVCQPCYNKIYPKEKEYIACVTQECIDEAFEWAKRHGINTTKEEMIMNMEDQIGKSIKIEKVSDNK